MRPKRFLPRSPPPKSPARLVLAEIRSLARQDPNAAIERAEQLLQQNPDNVDILQLTADVQQAAGQPEEALANRKRITELQPEADCGMAQPTSRHFIVSVGPRKRKRPSRQWAQHCLRISLNLPWVRAICFWGTSTKLGLTWNPSFEKKPNDRANCRDRLLILHCARKDSTMVHQLVDRLIAMDSAER